MKFIDTIKISLHNMWNNKTRTLLVTLVLFILSTLVTVILGISINVIKITNQISGYNDVVDLSMGYNWNKEVTNEEIEALKKIAEQSKILTHTCFEIEKPNTIAVDTSTNIYDGIDDSLISGRFWNKTDKNKPYCWVSVEYATTNHVDVGDVIALYEYNGSQKYYEVKGVVKNIIIGYYEVNCIIDAERVKTDQIPIRGLRFYSSRLRGKPTISDIMQIRDIVKANNKESQSNPEGLVVRSDYVDTIEMKLIMSGAILGGSLVLAIIVILLCIGCVSNSIQITVEQNRKFFGMMKAIGLRNATVKRIVRWQAVFMIVLSVIGASLVGMGVMALLKPQIVKLFYTNVPIDFALPFYVPFIVMFLLVSLVLIFTTKSLNKISRMDVVSVISEVN